MDLSKATNAELVAEHNRLATILGISILKSWKKAKTELMKKVELLTANVAAITPTPASKKSKRTPAPKRQRKSPSAPPRAVGSPEDTIRGYALQLLCEVAFYEDKGRKPSRLNRVDDSHKNAGSVGLTYDDILERIHTKFPGSQTSAACLRWYCVKVRASERSYDGFQLPRRRPRSTDMDAYVEAHVARLEASKEAPAL